MSLSNALRVHRGNWNRMQDNTMSGVKVKAAGNAMDNAIDLRGQDLTMDKARTDDATTRRGQGFDMVGKLGQGTGLSGLSLPNDPSSGWYGHKAGNSDPVMGHNKGGPVQGPKGLDRVAAQGPQGEPIRLNDGEYIQTREYVISVAREALGKLADEMSDEQLNAVGAKILDAEQERTTGVEPVPGGEPMPPLPEQVRGLVPEGAMGFWKGGSTVRRLDGSIAPLADVNQERRARSLFGRERLASDPIISDETMRVIPAPDTRLANANNPRPGMRSSLPMTPDAVRKINAETALEPEVDWNAMDAYVRGEARHRATAEVLPKTISTDIGLPMRDTSQERMSKDEWNSRGKANAIASAPIGNVEGNTLPAVGKPEFKARPGWEQENMRFKEATTGGNVVASPARAASPAPSPKDIEARSKARADKAVPNFDATDQELLALQPAPYRPSTNDLAYLEDGETVTDTGITSRNSKGGLDRIYKGVNPNAKEGEAKVTYSGGGQNAWRSATRKGSNEDFDQFGQGVDGARLYINAPLNDRAMSNLPRTLQSATTQGRAGLGDELRLAETRAISDWAVQPDSWQEKGQSMRKADMPDWVADRMGLPRRAETQDDYQIRQLIVGAPARARAQAQAEAQAAREKQMIAMTPQMMEHYRKAAKDTREQEKDFLDNGYRPIKGAPNDLLAGNIVSLAQGLNTRPSEIQALLREIIAGHESQYGEIDWSNKDTPKTILNLLKTTAASRFAQ